MASSRRRNEVEPKKGIVSEEVFDINADPKVNLLSIKQWRYDDDGFFKEMKKRRKLSKEWFFQNGVPTVVIVSGDKRYVNTAATGTAEGGDSWVRYYWNPPNAEKYDHYNPVDYWTVLTGDKLTNKI